MSTKLESNIINLFVNILNEDKTTLRTLSHFQHYQLDTSQNNFHFCFTVPFLFELMSAIYINEMKGIKYLFFRKTLYTNSTNTILKKYNAKVVVAESHEDHRLSSYRLIRMT